MTVNQHAQKQHLAYLEFNHHYCTRQVRMSAVKKVEYSQGLSKTCPGLCNRVPTCMFSFTLLFLTLRNRKKVEFEKNFYDCHSVIILKVFYLEEKVFCLSCRTFRQVC